MDGPSWRRRRPRPHPGAAGTVDASALAGEGATRSCFVVGCANGGVPFLARVCNRRARGSSRYELGAPVERGGARRRARGTITERAWSLGPLPGLRVSLTPTSSRTRRPSGACLPFSTPVDAPPFFSGPGAFAGGRCLAPVAPPGGDSFAPFFLAPVGHRLIDQSHFPCYFGLQDRRPATPAPSLTNRNSAHSAGADFPTKTGAILS